MRMRHIVICSPVRLYRIFMRYLINGMIFGKNVLNIKRVLRFSLKFLSALFIYIYIYIRRTSEISKMYIDFM